MDSRPASLALEQPARQRRPDRPRSRLQLRRREFRPRHPRKGAAPVNRPAPLLEGLAAAGLVEAQRHVLRAAAMDFMRLQVMVAKLTALHDLHAADGVVGARTTLPSGLRA